MNEWLRKRLRFGILERGGSREEPPVEVDYILTPFGRRFLRILDEVRRLQEAVDNGAVSRAGETPKEATRGVKSDALDPRCAERL